MIVGDKGTRELGIRASRNKGIGALCAALALAACSRAPVATTISPAAPPADKPLVGTTDTSSATPTQATSTSSQTTSAASTSSAATSTTSDQNQTPNKPESEAKPVALASSLQNDAYLYYGLGDDVHQKVNMIQAGKSYPGDHTFKNESKAADKAVYTETQTGTPQGDMTQTVTLTPEGLYLDGMSPFELKKKHVLLLPAKLSPGTSWTMDLNVEANGRSLEAKYTCRVVGFKTLSTKSGPLTALYLVGTGTGKADTQTLKTNDEWWYVKGKGAVKSLETVTSGGQTTKSETDITEP